MNFISGQNKISFKYKAYYIFARLLGKNMSDASESAREKAIVGVRSMIDKRTQVLIKNICTNF